MGGARKRKTDIRCCVALVVPVVVAGLLASGAGLWVPSALASGSADYAVVAGSATSTTQPSSSGSSALSTSLNAPNDVVVDSFGNPIVSDTDNNEVEVLATSSTNPGYVIGGGASWQPGNLYVIAGAGTSPAAPTISGSSALSTELNLPEAITVDREGNVVIADSGSNLVAVVAVSATNPGYPVGSWSRGNVYAIAGDVNTYPAPSYTGSASTTVGLDNPAGVAVDPDGNVVIADTFASSVAVLAVSSSNPGYQVGTASTWTVGDLYEIAGGGSTNPTFAGVSAKGAALNSPDGIAVDSDGDVVIADEQGNEVDLLSVSSDNSDFPSITSWARGNVYLLAGEGSTSPSSDGVASTSSMLDAPSSVSVDPAGNVLIANSHVNEIDLLTESSANPGYSLSASAVWQQHMVYLLVGEGANAPSSTGNNATAVALEHPDGVTAGADGSVFVADTGDAEVEQLNLAPSAPALTSVSASTNSVAITWSPPAQDGGVGVSGYQALVFSGSPTPFATVDISPSMNDTTVTGLASGTAYSIEVDSSNAVGISAPSNLIIFTTESIPEPPGTGPPPKPSTAPNSNLSPTKGNARTTVVLKVSSVRASSSAGFVSFLARCSDRSCAGTVTLKGIVRVDDATGGATHSILQTFVAGSSHFSIRGRRLAKVLVPLTQYARRVAASGMTIELRGVVSLDNGRKSFFSVLVAKRTRASGAEVQRRAGQAIHPHLRSSR